MEKRTDNYIKYERKPAAPMRPSESLDGNLTAHPSEPPDEQIEYGQMNEEDARESGYTDNEGHAVSLARKDVEGSPTKAFTDIGAGHSGVVKHEQ